MLGKVCILFFLGSTLGQNCPGPLDPGQPGGSWSSEELRIVRQKVCILAITGLYSIEIENANKAKKVNFYILTVR